MLDTENITENLIGSDADFRLLKCTLRNAIAYASQKRTILLIQSFNQSSNSNILSGLLELKCIPNVLKLHRVLLLIKQPLSPPYFACSLDTCFQCLWTDLVDIHELEVVTAAWQLCILALMPFLSFTLKKSIHKPWILTFLSRPTYSINFNAALFPNYNLENHKWALNEIAYSVHYNFSAVFLNVSFHMHDTHCCPKCRAGHLIDRNSTFTNYSSLFLASSHLFIYITIFLARSWTSSGPKLLVLFLRNCSL